MPKLHMQTQLAFVATAVLLLTACGHHSGALLTPHTPAPAANASRPQLPPPARLLDKRAAYTEAGLMRNGAQFDNTLPNNKAVANANSVVLSPGGSADHTGLAYAVYSFDVSNYDRDLNVRFTWSAAP